MFDNTHTKKLGVLATVTMLLLAAVMLGGAAAPTNDTETTNTAETSDWTAGTVVSNFNASENENATLSLQVDSTNPKVNFIDPESGETIRSYSGDSLTQSYADDANSTYYYNLTIKHSALAAMPMDAGENKSITVEYVNNTQVDSPDKTNFTVYLENTNERAVVFAGSDAVGDNGFADITSEEKWFGLGSAVDSATVDKNNVGINGTNTSVYVVYGNDTLQSTVADSADRGTSWFGLGSREAGDQLKYQQAILEDTNYAVYYEEAPEDVADNEDATYAVDTEVTGYQAHKIVLGAEDFEGETSVDTVTKLNEKAGFFTDVKKYEGGFLGFNSLSFTITPPALPAV